ncbi:MAG: multidrug efflux SMR transporter [Clostridia bacterium]|nr:multidrug efflux SMR transporter [Clostridia bacterium]
MAYILLGAAIVLELCATTMLKLSEGFTKILPTVLCLILYFVCFFCFSKSLLKINLGIAYATWCGVGIVATAIISAVVFKQGLSLTGILGLVLVVAGCIVLNLKGN